VQLHIVSMLPMPPEMTVRVTSSTAARRSGYYIFGFSHSPPPFYPPHTLPVPESTFFPLFFPPLFFLFSFFFFFFSTPLFLSS